MSYFISLSECYIFQTLDLFSLELCEPVALHFQISLMVDNFVGGT